MATSTMRMLAVAVKAERAYAKRAAFLGRKRQMSSPNHSLIIAACPATSAAFRRHPQWRRVAAVISWKTLLSEQGAGEPRSARLKFMACNQCTRCWSTARRIRKVSCMVEVMITVTTLQVLARWLLCAVSLLLGSLGVGVHFLFLREPHIDGPVFDIIRLSRSSRGARSWHGENSRHPRSRAAGRRPAGFVAGRPKTPFWWAPRCPRCAPRRDEHY